MKKPQPKREVKPNPEIIIREGLYNNPRVLSIYVGTEEARTWIFKEAPDYGGKIGRLNSENFLFAVSEVYDLDEVKEYLLSMGKQESLDSHLDHFATGYKTGM